MDNEGLAADYLQLIGGWLDQVVADIVPLGTKSPREQWIS